jgi:rifampin ADP-ribosylating transferase
MDEVKDDLEWKPVTFENCESVTGPFYHGTAALLKAGDLLMPGFASNYQKGRFSNHIYFSTTVASLAAQLATALTGVDGRGHVYIVEPTGPFEDDPNVTNKRFRGNPTKSYRSKHPLRIIGEVDDWDEHSPEVIQGMLDRLAALREQNLDLIED